MFKCFWFQWIFMHTLNFEWGVSTSKRFDRKMHSFRGSFVCLLIILNSFKKGENIVYIAYLFDDHIKGENVAWIYFTCISGIILIYKYIQLWFEHYAYCCDELTKVIRSNILDQSICHWFLDVQIHAYFVIIKKEEIVEPRVVNIWIPFCFDDEQNWT